MLFRPAGPVGRAAPSDIRLDCSLPPSRPPDAARSRPRWCHPHTFARRRCRGRGHPRVGHARQKTGYLPSRGPVAARSRVASAVTRRPSPLGSRWRHLRGRIFGPSGDRPLAHPVRARRLRIPPGWLCVLGTVPLCGKRIGRGRVDGPKHDAGVVVEPPPVVFAHLLEGVLVESRKTVYPLLGQLDDQRVVVAVHPGVTDRQQVVLRLEPTA